MRFLFVVAVALLVSIASAWRVDLYQHRNYKGMHKKFSGKGKRWLSKCLPTGRLHRSVSSIKWDAGYKSTNDYYCCLTMYTKKGCKKKDEIKAPHYSECHYGKNWPNLVWLGDDFGDKVNSLKVTC